jgi:hypothetical protein
MPTDSQLPATEEVAALLTVPEPHSLLEAFVLPSAQVAE